ncbi:alcohol dehydrogenase [Trichoderma arundinaceum]|uniref:Alcohol dehydrogenase n=1 Tax=Trichoderma arundinaceum TaxID=490622 RepID=A0A395P1B6_TRIAR|nr:alcohol dehydrogenase [Trichoderma arundinaceum]
MASLPSSMKALVLNGPGDGVIKTVPVPQAVPGSIIVQVLHLLVYQITPDVFHGTVPNPGMKLPYPLTFGSPAIGRVAAVGPDTTAFKPGHLVLIDTNLRARDDPNVSVVWGAFDGFDEKTKHFVKESWRDGTWSEYVRAPLENTWALDEDKLIGKLGLKVEDLLHLALLPVLYSGLRKIDVKAGETVLIAPATGVFSGGCIAVARAMGANVIAGGRNAESLEALKARFPGIQTVQLKGEANDVASIQAFGQIDAFVDLGPWAATGSSYLGSAIQAVRKGGRVCLLGGRADATLPAPYLAMMFNDITIRGSYMFEGEHVRALIRMTEAGILKLNGGGGFEVLASYPFEKYAEALERGRSLSAGKIVVVNL